MSTFARRLILLLVLLLFLAFCNQQQGWHIRSPSVFHDPTTLRRSSSRLPIIPVFHYNWTILLAVNEGFRDMFSNWWWHYQRLGIRVPIIIVTEDDVAFAKLGAEFKAHSNTAVTVERSPVVSIPEASSHNTKDYKKIVSARATHILKYLQEGRNVLYSDIDTVWLKNPFTYFIGDYDMWIEQETGMGARKSCTGFMAIKSSEITIKLMKDWEEALNKTLQLNQPVFNRILEKSNVKYKLLNEDVFPPGWKFNKYDSENRSRVVVMHNTFVYGHQNKIERFKKFNLWF